MKRKHLKILVEENKHINCALDLEDRTSKSKIENFNQKPIPADRDQIKGLYIYSFITNIRHCTKIH